MNKTDSPAQSAWRIKNADRLKQMAKELRKKNKAHYDEYRKQWVIKNREKLREQSKARYKLNPTPYRMAKRRWSSRNKPMLAEAARSWRINHKGYYTEYWRMYRKLNPGKIAAHRHNAKARRRDAYVGDKLVDKKIIQWRSDKTFICAYCLKEFDTGNLHIEHIVPIIRGGKHCCENVCQSCPSCNLRKNSKTAEEFMATV